MSDIKQILRLLHQGEISKKRGLSNYQILSLPTQRHGSESDAFAVVGMSCRYPQSVDIDEFLAPSCERYGFS